jgi:ADP-ribose diphosphatase
MREKPRILEQIITAKSRLFTVESLKLRFSNGQERHYERLIGSGRKAVMVVAMLDENTVLLVREYAAGLHDYHVSLPKGLVETGEDVLSGANRELMEETGYGARRLQELKPFSLSPGYMTHTTHVVLAQDLYEAKLEGDEPEPLDVIPVALDNLMQFIEREDVSEARSIAALFMVRELLRELK